MNTYNKWASEIAAQEYDGDQRILEANIRHGGRLE